MPVAGAISVLRNRRPTMSEVNKTVVRRIIEEHWNNKNAPLVSELFASDVPLDTPDGLLFTSGIRNSVS